MYLQEVSSLMNYQKYKIFSQKAELKNGYKYECSTNRLNRTRQKIEKTRNTKDSKKRLGRSRRVG